MTIQQPTEYTRRAPMSNNKHVAGYVLAAAAVLILLGSFLPWATLTAPLVGSINKSGVQGGDGFISIGGAVILGVFAVMLIVDRLVFPSWIIAVSVALTGCLVYEVADLDRRFRDVHDVSRLVATQYGTGLYVMGLGILAGLVVGFYLLASKPTR